jgi:hypothetical protein
MSLTNSFILPHNNENYIKKTDFVGSPYFNVVAMYFISHKHDNACVILAEPYETDENKIIDWLDGKDHEHDDECVLLPKDLNHIPNNQRAVSLRYVEQKGKKTGYISVPKPEKKFWDNFKKCKSKRFVVMPFGFDCIDSGHANWLLYDKKTKSLERFESYGKINDKKCLNPTDLDEKIEKLFKENLGDDYIQNYYHPLSYSPARNIQTLQEAEGEKLEVVGFCSVWSCFWIDLRLSNPDIDRKELLNMAIKELKKIKKEKNISFTQFIRNYSGLIVNVSKEIKKMYDVQ